MKRRRPRKPSLPSRKAKAEREVEVDAKLKKRQKEVRASWAAGILSVLFAAGSVSYFLAVTGPPYQGRGAALAAALHGDFGPIGPTLPWLGISAIMAFICIAAAYGWSKDVD